VRAARFRSRDQNLANAKHFQDPGLPLQMLDQNFPKTEIWCPDVFFQFWMFGVRMVIYGAATLYSGCAALSQRQIQFADFIKVGGSQEISFYKLPCTFAIQFINLLGSNEEIPQRACRKTFQIQMPWILLMCFPVGNWSIR
jgi:hypothetical protein